MRIELLRRVTELRDARMPFVVATVVRVARPASARPGDSAILLPDGTLEGFVGGMCSETTVRTQGLRQLASGRSVLLHITPPSGLVATEGTATGASQEENEVTVGNPCLSGGALDIFLEVMRPPALVYVYGDTPVARALAAVGGAAGADVRPTTDADAAISVDAAAVVVASQGGDEHKVLTAALGAGVPYVGLLASRRRAAAVIEALGIDEDQRARVHAPVGLDIGAQSPGEIAISVLAEIIAVTSRLSHRGDDPPGSPRAPGGYPLPATSRDPVCGMTVAVTESAIRAETKEGPVYFCCPGCRDAFLADPGRYTNPL
jgi:xanthine dehydrogenase accessory factor